MGTKIKLCGMFREEDIGYANELLPDYIGFVINFPKSHRSIDIKTAVKLRKMLLPQIKAVGVFVNQQPEICAEIANRGAVDLIQLHGREDAEYIKNLRSLTNAPIIKAVKVASEADISDAQKIGADYLLLDGGTGEGKAFDHRLLENAELSLPFFLAGGLTAENVRAAVDKYHPFAVDVSSALEVRGFKDKNKMTDFVNAVRKEI